MRPAAAGAGFGQDAPAPPATDDWGAAPAAGAAGQSVLLQQQCVSAHSCVHSFLCCMYSVSCPSAALAAHSLASKASQLILMYVVQMDGMQLLLLPLSRLSLLALTSLVPSTRCSAENSGLLTY